MKKIIQQIKELEKTNIKNIINTRLKEFDDFKNKNNLEWFSELCFCILTANSRAITAISIQKELGKKGFINYSSEKIKQTIIKNHHRFHNRKTNYIILAREYINIKDIISEMDNIASREWIKNNIKGISYKEASHFLRNTGHTNVSIIDRHILRLLKEHNYINKIPSSLSKKTYFFIEDILKKIAKKLKMSLSELDLYMWYIKTGNVLK